jgi:hypothetical protein
MSMVKHPKNRHVMAASAKSKPYVPRAVKPNRNAARAAMPQADEIAVPETPELATTPPGPQQD